MSGLISLEVYPILDKKTKSRILLKDTAFLFIEKLNAVNHIISGISFFN